MVKIYYLRKHTEEIIRVMSFKKSWAKMMKKQHQGDLNTRLVSSSLQKGSPLQKFATNQTLSSQCFIIKWAVQVQSK